MIDAVWIGTTTILWKVFALEFSAMMAMTSRCSYSLLIQMLETQPNIFLNLHLEREVQAKLLNKEA